MLLVAAAALLPAVAQAGTAAAAPTSSPYYGRWAVSEERPAFSARGREYKTIDIAPCSRDFCGVSVADSGACGPTLFRFLAKRASGEGELRGHGKWGAARKNVLIYTYDDDSTPGAKGLQLYLGDGYDFGERSENMPKFESFYRRTGHARCAAR